MVDFFAFILDLMKENNIANIKLIEDEITRTMSGVFSSDMRAIYDIFAQIGVCLLLVYFCMDLLDKLSSENFSIDVMILDFVKLIGGYALILNGFDILHGISGLADMAGVAIGNAARDTIGSNLPGVSGAVEDFLDIIIWFAQSFFGQKPNLLDLILSSLITQIVVTLVCCQRAIRIAIRMLAAPFVLADVIGHGMNNNAMHYIRKLFALFMQGPIMVAGVAMSVAANPAYAGTGVSPFGTVSLYNLLLTLACAKILLDSKSMSEDLFV